MKKYLVLFMFLAGVVLFGKDVQPTVSWDANTEPDLAGYRLYWGTESGKYDNERDVGLNTLYEYKNLKPGTHFFAVKAYDLSGNLSDFSDEVSYTISFPDTTAPAAPTGVKLLVPVKTH